MAVGTLIGVVGVASRIEMLRVLSGWLLLLALPALLLIAALLTPWVLALTDICGGLSASAVNWAMADVHMGLASPVALIDEFEVRQAVQAVFAATGRYTLPICCTPASHF